MLVLTIPKGATLAGRSGGPRLMADGSVLRVILWPFAATKLRDPAVLIYTSGNTPVPPRARCMGTGLAYRHLLASR